MAKNIDRVKSGVRGLDKLIQGGYPKNGVHLVSGPSGSGKSLFALHYIYNGSIENDEAGLYLTLEESKANVLLAMEGFGMEPEKYESAGKIKLLDMTQLRSLYIRKGVLEKGLIGFSTLQDLLENLFRLQKPKRLAIDSLVSVGLFYKDVDLLRQDLFVFSQFLRQQEVTTLLITEAVDEVGFNTKYGNEPFIADSFLALALENVKGELRRSLQIRKMRFTDHDKGQYPVLIDAAGMKVHTETVVF
jgi:KaiC/GvpD/RAD55 family RecA-like ATPase